MLIWDELCYKLSKSKKYELVLVMFDCGGGDTAVLVLVYVGGTGGTGGGGGNDALHLLSSHFDI